MTSPNQFVAQRRVIAHVLYAAAASAVVSFLPSIVSAAECSPQTGYGSCSMQFCMDWPDDGDCRAAWYTVSGTRFSCVSCSNLSTCLSAAANRCAALAQGGGVTPGTSVPSPSSGSNSCEYANDGECDHGSYCSYGTDTADCGSSGSTSTGGSSSGGGSSTSGGSSSSGGTSSSSGTNSCRYAYDGECDEGDLCARGTDSSDCRGSSAGSNSCRYSYDGACDEPTLCTSGTDTYDCENEDSGGCSMREQAKHGVGLGGVSGALLFGLFLVRRRHRRGSAAEQERSQR